MSKFLTLCEENDPNNTYNPKYELYDFLKSKGIKVSIIRNTNMLYIDTGTKTIPVVVKSNEEDSQETDLVRDAASNNPEAAKVIADRDKLIPPAIKKVKQDTDELKRRIINKPYIIKSSF